MEHAEGLRRWREFRPPFPVDSALPVLVTAPVVDVPPDVVEKVQPDSVTEYAVPAAAVSDAALAPVVDYIAAAPRCGGDSIGVS